MFNIGWPELLLVMVIALVVIGPKDLPAAIRAFTLVVRKARGMAAEFQSGLNEIAREAGVDEIKRGFDDVVSYDPKAALDNITDLDDGEFSYEDTSASVPANSILDRDRQPQAPPDGGGESAAGADEPSADNAPDQPASPVANEDQPASAASAATPASGRS